MYSKRYEKYDEKLCKSDPSKTKVKKADKICIFCLGSEVKLLIWEDNEFFVIIN